MSALGSSHLEDPQRLALGIIFSTEVGAEVYGLVSGGPAERAGLQQGDQLIAVAGEEVFSAAGVVLQLADAVAGQPGSRAAGQPGSRAAGHGDLVASAG